MIERLHVDVVGSFLRPDYLLFAREQGLAGDELRELENQAIIELLQLQKQIGLPIVTDGEYRRGHWTHGILQIADGFKLIDGFPIPVAPLRWKTDGIEADVAFILSHTDRPVKVTLPQPTALGLLWDEEHSFEAYPSRDMFVEEVVSLLNQQARALVQAGVAYIQIDAPQYTVAPADTTPEQYKEMVAIDARVFDGVEGVVTGVHLCRGNYRRPADALAAPYDPYAREVFSGFHINRLLLEYDDYQAGDFSPLTFVPEDVTVVLGLITTKWPALENEDDIVRRIEEASMYLPLERLALSPQCGFSSLATLQNVTADVQRAKLELMMRVSERVWG